jgi:outer membrane protein TolC
VPNDVYYERIKGLEDALRQAEDELEAAQQAYRRGTD